MVANLSLDYDLLGRSLEVSGDRTKTAAVTRRWRSLSCDANKNAFST